MIGLQEVCELTAGAIVSDMARAARTDSVERRWVRLVEGIVNEGVPGRTLPRYVSLKSRQLVGLLMMVFVRVDLMRYARNVQSAVRTLLGPFLRVSCADEFLSRSLCLSLSLSLSPQAVGVGIMNMVGNKGAVSMSFEMGETKICVVGAHMAARQSNYDKRNDNFATIEKSISFEPRRVRSRHTHTRGGSAGSTKLKHRMNLAGASPALARTRESSRSSKASRSSVASADTQGADEDDHKTGLYDHDIVIWLGDLNYRLDALDVEGAQQLVDAGKTGEMWEHNDQLARAQREKAAFADFREGPVTFQPTYPMSPDSQNYDPGVKERVAAWCDRVLWWEPRQSNGGLGSKGVNFVSYDAHFGVMGSDHRPVSAQLDIEAVVDAAKASPAGAETPRLPEAAAPSDDGPPGEMASNTVAEGYLYKRGLKNQGWRWRWFIITSNNLVRYYRDPDATFSLGVFRLDETSSVAEVVLEEHQFAFVLRSKERDLILAADNGQQRFHFMMVLNVCIENVKELPARQASASSLPRSRIRSTSGDSETWVVVRENGEEGLPRDRRSLPKLIDPSGSTMPPVFEGFLKKRGGNRRALRKRWFVLRPPKLYYFKSSDDLRTPKGEIDLQDSTLAVGEDDTGEGWEFRLLTLTRTYFLHAADEETRAQWMRILFDEFLIVDSPNAMPPVLYSKEDEEASVASHEDLLEQQRELLEPPVYGRASRAESTFSMKSFGTMRVARLAGLPTPALRSAADDAAAGRDSSEED